MFEVLAQSHLRNFGPLCEPRTEVIDTDTNRLFAGMTTEPEIKARYEAFWNDINPRSLEVVKVLSVKRVVGATTETIQ